jgi:hypothetical protein
LWFKYHLKKYAKKEINSPAQMISKAYMISQTIPSVSVNPLTKNFGVGVKNNFNLMFINKSQRMFFSGYIPFYLLKDKFIPE